MATQLSTTSGIPKRQSRLRNKRAALQAPTRRQHAWSRDQLNVQSSACPQQRSRGPTIRCAASSENSSNGSDKARAVDALVYENGIIVEEAERTPFSKILVANRGEIAVRIFRAGTELGLRTVAIYSPADRLQQHRYKADESYPVGSADVEPVQSYLDIEGILAVAKEEGVDCIHPGYGFLAENSTFARRCAEEGIAFVGPNPETIKEMGDKTQARKAAEACGVPVVPGTNEALTTADAAHAFAKKSGYPIILKAAMGGGGRGMRVVRAEDELDDAFKRASNEALASFGDGSMFVERYVIDPRHVEVQILADHHGNVVHLHERDCSVQRRHQKVIELAPAFGLDPSVRAALHRDAVKIARHVNYRNAGTVEFMVEPNGNYYFLEVNPRVQVEHTVTEEVTGVDIVQSQIRIAGGATLESIGLGDQEAVGQPAGYSLQCRITCEDPTKNFQPDTGRIQAYRSPGGPGIRLDGAMSAGNVVSKYYDSLLVKVIVRGKTYIQAVQKMQRALYEFDIRGIKTNIRFLENCLRHPEFLSGTATTSFIDRNPQLIGTPPEGTDSSRLLEYLGGLVVNGPNHAGAVGPPPTRLVPAAPEVPDCNPPPGWRSVLLEKGPEGFARAVREHKGVLLTDTTWRDAHQSLLATRMRTHDILKAAPYTAHAMPNLLSLENWGGATFDVSLRFLHEDPWQRLEQMRALVPNIPFQMLLRGANAVGYTAYSDNVCRAFAKEAVNAGMDIFRVFDSLNYVDNLRFGIDAVRDAGGVAEGTICYTGDISDPNKQKYSLEYYLEMADALVSHGVHMLCIKDMAGLLRPRAATQLVTALRKQFPDTPLHVHTHDTAGTGVATQLACAMAGADAVDAAIDSMSGCTSQPSMGAIINGLAGMEGLETGIKPEAILPLVAFWEQTRGLYAPFEADMRAGSSDVYLHEMPGGQYTNLKFQAYSLGLGSERWEEVKIAYAAANRVLGDIVKVTPSSKVVGDLSQFMVQNDLDEHQLVEQAGELALPNSVVEFLQGMIGQPPFGQWPEPFRSRVIKDKPQVKGRPGASLPPVNLRELQSDLEDKYPEFQSLSDDRKRRDVLSYSLYPQVYDDFKTWCFQHSSFTEKLPTRAFLVALEEDEEIEAVLSQGVTTNIKFKAISEIQPGGKVEVFFEVNGVPRVVEVPVKQKPGAAAGRSPVSAEKADLAVLGSVGAPMAGSIIEVIAKPGFYAKAGQPLLVMSAMKMETAVSAPMSGMINHIAVEKGDSVEAGDLLVRMEEGEEPENPFKSLDPEDIDSEAVPFVVP